MERSKDKGIVDMAGERKREVDTASASSSASVYRLFGKKMSIHQVMGGGKAADLIMWKQWRVSCGVIVIATVMWLLFEKSRLPFLSVCSDVVLILVVFLYVRANHAALRNKLLTDLPELVLSEEAIHSAATSFRVKVNNILIMAHDITLGKDFRLFFKVVFCLWLFSAVASVVSLFTLVYIGIIGSVTLPALYSRYGEHVDRFAGIIHRSFSTRYKIVDENDAIRLHHSLPNDKDE